MKNIIYIIAAFLFTINLVNCTKASENKTIIDDSEKVNSHEGIIVTKAQFESNKMQLETLSKKSFPDLVKLTGMIDVPPQSKEVISSFYGGYIKKSSLLIGDKVKKGQVLVSIENIAFVEMQQEYLEIIEQLAYLKSEYTRQKLLFEEKISSQKNYLKAESEYKKSLARASGIRKKLQMLNIDPKRVEQGKFTSIINLYASIDGSVTQINVSKGTYVSPADVIIEIVNTDHFHLELTAFEKDLLQIKEGQKIIFKIPETSDLSHFAEVHLVGTSIDQNTRTAKIHGHLSDEENYNFAIGMFIDAEIEITSSESLAINENAILERGKETVVLVLESFRNNQYTFKTIEVKTGSRHNGYVEILSSNIDASSKILTKGGYDLLDTEGGGHQH